MEFLLQRIALAVSAWIAGTLITFWAIGGDPRDLTLPLFAGIVLLPLFMVLAGRLLKPPESP